jgi:uncharacterized protein YxeA
MKKTLWFVVIIILVFVIFGSLFYLKTKKILLSDTKKCEEFMVHDLPNTQYQTEENVIKKCDNSSFIELSHEYGKDKNVVYFKPMPNANKMTVILEGADAKTFNVINKCPSLAIDKSNVYELGKKKTTRNNPNDNEEKYCNF